MSPKIKRRLRIAAVLALLLALCLPVAWLAAPALLCVDTGLPAITAIGSGRGDEAPLEIERRPPPHVSGHGQVGGCAVIVLGGELWTRPQRAAEVYWEVVGEQQKAESGKETTGPWTTDNGLGKRSSSNVQHSTSNEGAPDLQHSTFNAQPSTGAPFVIVTGEGDCEDVRRLMEERRVPADRIVTECKSTSTFENAKFSVELLRERGVSNAVIVTSWFHSRRALACFRDAAPEITFYSCPTERPVAKSRWPDKYERNRFTWEYAKLLYYWLVHGVPPV